ncbi:cyclase family protein [Paenibacillus cremeus]|uniref:Cyclase family protein n=1 Tax=Paenibacillus cremeus TaxID=2163881 RepID=A0A559KGP5_9BACL|nr:cyclase family protein [Paenibacillus cremeus]TVY11291.1 cyclase family protein [Paenibacillus cremeus]
MSLSSAKMLSALLNDLQVIDLSHTLEENMPSYPTHSRYFHTLWDHFDQGSRALVYQLILNEHTGTHMDATAHFIQEGHPAHRYMAETEITQFFGRALTLDFSHYEAKDTVSLEEIVTWEQQNGSIETGDIVLLRFGWDRYWTPRTVDHPYTKSWPGLGGEAAEYLAGKRVKAVGCDTLAIDSSFASGTPAHYALLGNGVNIIENLTRLEQILGESFVFAFPLKIKEGSGSPIRALAFK